MAIERLPSCCYARCNRRYGATLPDWSAPPDADDVLQDTLVIVIRRLGGLEDLAAFRAWTFRIASREAFRAIKKRRLVHDRQDDDVALDQLASPHTAPSSELLDHLLTSDVLSAASRAVLMLHFREELPLAEVAAILDIPLGTVKSRLAYGLAALRKHAVHAGGFHGR